MTNLALMLSPDLTDAQIKLARKHGTPAEFAVACWYACPAEISADEAEAAIAKYQREWDKAGKLK